MKKEGNGGAARRIRRGIQMAAVLSVLSFWAIRITAGNRTAVSALQIFQKAEKMTALWDTGTFSPAAAIALGQSPLLYSMRDRIAPQSTDEKSSAIDMPLLFPETAESSGTGANSDAAENLNTEKNSDAAENLNTVANEESEETAPLWETPLEPEQPVDPVDNGIKARTLIPTSTSGYTVVGRTYISSTRTDSLNVSALSEPFDAELTGDAPQILILHSHGSEAYTPVPGTEVVWSGESRTTDFRYSVVRAGDEMASIFADAGVSVLHDRTLYDYPNYTGSYDRSLAAINSYLAQYPSIRFILDVHRDFIADSKGNPYKVVSEIDGLGTAAQMTLVMGSDGSGARHPRWMENLKLAVAIQEQILAEYPTLMRPILLRKSRYNQHATTGSLLVEVGAAGNAPEEAFLSARIFARKMAEVLIARSK